MKTILFLAFFLALGTPPLFAELSPALMRDYEKIKVIYFDAKTKEKRADLTYEISNKNHKEPNYLLTRYGKGSCDKFKEISWDTLAEISEKDGRLQVLSSKCSARDKNGNMLLGYEKIFDYAKAQIYWTQFDKNGKPTKRVTFPIKGVTTDDVTMAFFLKAYVKHRNEPGYKNFYLLTNEPKLYKVNFKLVGTETLELPIGKKRALKIKTTADMGIVDDILDKYVPHTYFWYEDSPDLQWLQYQGLETSINSAYVIASIAELETSSPHLTSAP